MKKIIMKGLLLTAMVGFLAACENDPGLEAPIDSAEFSEESEVESDLDDVDFYTSEGMELEVYSQNSGSKLLGRRHLPECAEVTHDPEAMTVTIDFGESCEGRGGKIFSGKILITYTDRKYMPGSVITTTFEDFTVDGKLIEGVRVVENISESLEDDVTFHVTLTGGKVTFPDGLFATWEVDKTKKWIRASNPLNDEFHVLEGSTANGANKNGVEFSALILETLIVKNICKLEGVHIPVDGLKEVTKGDRQYTIDFGDGECDNTVVITSGDRIETVDLSRRTDSANG